MRASKGTKAPGRVKRMITLQPKSKFEQATLLLSEISTMHGDEGLDFAIQQLVQSGNVLALSLQGAGAKSEAEASQIRGVELEDLDF